MAARKRRNEIESIGTLPGKRRKGKSNTPSRARVRGLA